MALPAAAPIDLLQVYSEFGAPVGTPLTSMVRGGAYVPDTLANAGVPTAPPISVLDFLGASAAPAVTFGDYSAGAFSLSPGDADAALILLSNGVVQRALNNGGAVNIGTWLPGGNGADFDIFVTGQGPDPINELGQLGVWLNMGTNRAFSITNTSNLETVKSNTLDVVVRPAGGGANVDSGTLYLEAAVGF